jgi:hypothetical protein
MYLPMLPARWCLPGVNWFITPIDIPIINLQLTYLKSLVDYSASKSITHWLNLMPDYYNII